MILENPKAISEVVALLGSERTLLILRLAAERPVSVPQLMIEFKIPRSAAYRRIKALSDAGLLVRVKSSRTPDGHWFEEYMSAANEYRIYVKESGIAMELVSAKGMARNILKLWAYMGRK